MKLAAHSHYLRLVRVIAVLLLLAGRALDLPAYAPGATPAIAAESAAATATCGGSFTASADTYVNEGVPR